MQELIKALRCTSDDHFQCDHNCRYYTRCSDEEIKQFCEENGHKEEDFAPEFFCYCDTNRVGREAADALEYLLNDRQKNIRRIVKLGGFSNPEKKRYKL